MIKRCAHVVQYGDAKEFYVLFYPQPLNKNNCKKEQGGTVAHWISLALYVGNISMK